MEYTIKRECWNHKTYNGYVDNPYWMIGVRGQTYGVNDNGKAWPIGDSLPVQYCMFEIKNILEECKLNIILNAI